MADVRMQARSSTDGALYFWNASAPDFAGAGFPGPGTALDVAVSMRPAGSGGGSGLVVSGTPAPGDTPVWNGTGAVWGSGDPYDITAFAATTPVVEVGATVTNPAFTAAHNVAPTSLQLTNSDNADSFNVVGTPNAFAATHSVAKTTNNASRVYTLSGVNITPDTRQTSIFWRPRIYWGIGAAGGNSEAFIEALASSALQSSRATSFSVNATGTNKIYWAAPASYGTPTFTVGGFAGGFTLVSNTISVTNANGVNQMYQLWESVTAGLGTTAVVVS